MSAAGVDEPLSSLGHRRRLARSTAAFAGATAGSRLIGLVREVVIRKYFGVSGAEINAFTVAFAVPNLVRSIVADQALSGAFVPVFSELLARGEKARAWRVASTVLFLLTLALSALCALAVILAPLIVKAFGLDPDATELAVTLSRILFPTVVLLGMSGVIVGILNSYEHFSVPALAPIAWNLVIILGVVLGAPFADTTSQEVTILAVAVLVGTVVQVLLPIPWLMRLDGRLRVLVDWRDPAVRRVFRLMLPISIGLGLINFNLLIDLFFASRFIDPDLAPASIDAAFRLYMLPQGIFSVAVATVLFPALSRMAAMQDMDGFRQWVSRGLRQIGFLLIPASAASAALAVPITRLVYERGEFRPEDTTVVAASLAAFSLGLLFNGTMLMLNRAFFSLQQPWIPTGVALGNLALNAGLDWALYPLGIWAIPLVTSIVNIVGTVALVVLLRRRLGDFGSGDVVAAYARCLLAAAAATGIAYAIWYGLDRSLGTSLGAQIVSLGLALAAGTCAYIVASSALRVRELEALLTLAGRFGRPTGGGRRRS